MLDYLPAVLTCPCATVALLAICRDEKMLHRSELFELFARHKSDPQYWTPVRWVQP